jgi:hypothetical protein
VKWPGDVRLFGVTRDRDESRTLLKWHEAEVRHKANGATRATLALIKSHYERVGGLVNLMPSQEPNSIVLG